MRRMLLVTACVCLARSASADPFTVLPNGDLVFNVAVTSHGVFTCSAAMPCVGSGTNSVILGSGDATRTLRFEGVDTSWSLGNTTRPVVLGTFISETQPGFLLPSLPSSGSPILSFSLFVAHTSPVAAEAGLGFEFGPAFTQTLRQVGQDTGTTFVLPAGVNPPGYNYTALVYALAYPFPFDPLPDNGRVNVDAVGGAVPEPSSLLLLGTGIVGLIRRRGHPVVSATPRHSTAFGLR